LRETNDKTVLATKDYIAAVDKIAKCIASENVNFKSFEFFCGEGQQYLSLIKI
jgi:hypothetical protein